MIDWARVSIALAFCCASAANSAQELPRTWVAVYYDETDAAASLSVNLFKQVLGHFAVELDVKAVGNHASNSLSPYNALIYVSTDNARTLPAAFTNDVARFTNSVLWIDNNINEFLPAVTNRGITYVARRSTTAFRNMNVVYKGETLTNQSDHVYEISVVSPAVVRAQISNGSTTLPYVVQSGKFWYFATNPVSSPRHGDRVLVLADLLHEILDTGQPTRKRALVRIEDMRPEEWDITGIIPVCSAIQRLGAVPNGGIISRHMDPPNALDIPMASNRVFTSGLASLARSNMTFLAHGYTHQKSNEVSGGGSEFWNTSDDIPPRSPLAYDSWSWASGRVNSARRELSSAGFPVRIWETPHYEASLLDYHVFADTHQALFEPARGFAAFTEGLSQTAIATASSNNPTSASIYLPYVSLSGMFGAGLISENGGYVSPSEKDDNKRFMTASNVVAYAQNVRVVRDAVFAFFYHPYLDIHMVTNIVTQVQALGYEFVSAEDLIDEPPVLCMTNRVQSRGSPWTVSGGATNTGIVYVGQPAGSDVAEFSGATVSNEMLIVGPLAGAASNHVRLVSATDWTTRHSVYVGERGSGNEMLVSNAVVATRELVLGANAGASSNRFTVHGAGADFRSRLGVYAGRQGASNAVLAAAGSRLASRYLEVGSKPGALRNSVSLSDASAWSNEYWIVVGRQGCSNSLSVLDASVLRGEALDVGHGWSATGNTVLVSGTGATLAVTGTIGVGRDGYANALIVTNGGLVSCAGVTIGDFDRGDNNRLRVAGTGSLRADGPLSIGPDGNRNRLEVFGGGFVESDSAILGRYTGVTNDACVNGTGSTWVVNGTLSISGGVQNCTIYVTNGGSVLVHTLTGSGTIVVGPTGRFIYETQTNWTGTIRLLGTGVFAKSNLVDLALDAATQSVQPATGDPVVWTVCVTNRTAATVTGIVVAVATSPALTLQAWGASAGSFNSGSGQWTLPPLGSNVAAYLALSNMLLTASGPTFTNEAHIVSAGGADLYEPDNARSLATDRSWLLTASAGAHGSVNPGNARVAHGGGQSFDILADPHYRIASILTNGTDTGWSGQTNAYAFLWADVRADGTIAAAFAAKTATNGTPEWWLADYRLTNATPDVEELDDPDEDGARTWEEYVAGTDPTNKASVARFPTPEIDGGSFVLGWSSAVGRVYNIEQSELLTNGFQPLCVRTATPPWNAVTNAVTPGMRFYRFRVKLDE